MTNKLLSSPETLQDLQDFMFDTMLPAEMCVDWFCDRFGVSATDEVIDFVVDTHFAMFADQWPLVLYNTHTTHTPHAEHLSRLPQRLAERLDSQGQSVDWHI